MNWILDDLKYAVNVMTRNRFFTVFTLLILAAGFSLCIFMLSFINGSLKASMPFVNGDRLHRIDAVQHQMTYNGDNMTLHEFEHIKNSSSMWSSMDVYYEQDVAINLDDEIAIYKAHFVSDLFFEVSDASPQLGRVLTAQDLQKGAPEVVVLSYGVWQTLFAGDQEIISKQLRVEGKLTTIVGVMPQDYRFPDAGKIWLPQTQRALDHPFGEGKRVTLFGLLQQGITEAQASIEVTRIMGELESSNPKVNNNRTATVRTFQIAKLGNGTETIALLMLSSVALIMFLACINVASLLYSRALERTKETAIRIAMGAPQIRLIAQIMMESFLICTIATVLAIGVSGLWLYSVNSRLDTLLAFDTPFWWQIGLSLNSVFIAIALALVTALVTGVLPAWKISRGNINEILRDGTRGAQSQSSSRLSRLIVIFEIFLSCVLMMVASGMVNSILQQKDAQYGANIKNVLSAEIRLPEERFENEQTRVQLYENLKNQLLTGPMVASVTMGTKLPGEYAWYPKIFVEHKDYGTGSEDYANVVAVDKDFFNTFDIDVIQGRGFDGGDRIDTPLVVVVTRSFANAHWPGAEVLGKRFRVGTPDNEALYTVVGVIDSVLHGQPLDNIKSRTTVYRSLQQAPKFNIRLAIKTKDTAYAANAHLLETLAKVIPGTAAFQVTSIEDAMEKRLSSLNFVNELFTVFALISLILAFTGIYGVMSKSITQKRFEIAIKRAVGANDGNVFSYYMMIGGKQLLFGLLAGLPVGFLILSYLQTTGLASLSLIAVVLVQILLILIIFFAVFIPVRKAIEESPAIALKNE